MADGRRKLWEGRRKMWEGRSKLSDGCKKLAEGRRMMMVRGGGKLSEKVAWRVWKLLEVGVVEVRGKMAEAEGKWLRSRKLLEEVVGGRGDVGGRRKLDEEVGGSRRWEVVGLWEVVRKLPEVRGSCLEAVRGSGRPVENGGGRAGLLEGCRKLLEGRRKMAGSYEEVVGGKLVGGSRKMGGSGVVGGEEVVGGGSCWRAVGRWRKAEKNGGGRRVARKLLESQEDGVVGSCWSRKMAGRRKLFGGQRKMATAGSYGGRRKMWEGRRKLSEGGRKLAEGRRKMAEDRRKLSKAGRKDG
ncbi:hypothetical protein FNV43_RR19299 [Rhamnella rubrinervis]|uniref:Uncharacterized protein n=1 Tax=Rhamnella rubrinervis TaxID=2594499 RepID=A0A8K0GX25_9ROSA|nr:hypothetical protein FNV43_RR19299 [Rhamnella rubrinervis]